MTMAPSPFYDIALSQLFSHGARKIAMLYDSESREFTTMLLAVAVNLPHGGTELSTAVTPPPAWTLHSGGSGAGLFSTENAEFCVLLRRSVFLCIFLQCREMQSVKRRGKTEQLLGAEKRRNAMHEKRIAGLGQVTQKL